MGWKYVIIRTRTHDIPVLFPDCLVHVEVARAVCKIRHLEEQGAEPLSAGDLQIMAGSCFGESETLKLKSREDEDDACINSFMYGVRGMRDQY